MMLLFNVSAGDDALRFVASHLKDSFRESDIIARYGEVQGRFGQPGIKHADLRHPTGYALRLDGVTTATEPVNPTPKNGTKR